MTCAVCTEPVVGRNKTCGKACANKLRATYTGRRPTNFKGSTKTTSGYIYRVAEGHPNANKAGYVAEHRLVAEHRIGRLLHKSERVHHRNGVRDDNRPENLEVWVVGGKDPHGARAVDLWREVEQRVRGIPAEHMNRVRRAFEEVFGFGSGNATT